jgi:hypothetical protein
MSSTTTPKYLDLISKDEKQQNQEEIQAKVETARINTDHACLQVRGELNNRKRELNKAMASHSFDPQSVVIAQRRVKQAEEDLAAVEALKLMF